VHEVDERLEREFFGRAVVRPERVVVVRVGDAPEVLEPAARLPERVALDVEEEVAVGRQGEGQQTAVRD